jgi:hypothetical protein
MHGHMNVQKTLDMMFIMSKHEVWVFFWQFYLRYDVQSKEISLRSRHASCVSASILLLKCNKLQQIKTTGDKM